MQALLKSRKFWAAIVGVVGVVLAQYGVPEERVNEVTLAIVTLITAVIGGTAWEDAAQKKAGGGK